MASGRDVAHAIAVWNLASKSNAKSLPASVFVNRGPFRHRKRIIAFRANAAMAVWAAFVTIMENAHAAETPRGAVAIDVPKKGSFYPKE